MCCGWNYVAESLTEGNIAVTGIGVAAAGAGAGAEVVVEVEVGAGKGLLCS